MKAEMIPRNTHFIFISESMCVHMLSCFSCVRLFATAWTVACQVLLSIGFSRQEYWSGLPCSSPGDLPNPRTEPTSAMCPLHWHAGSLPLVLPGKPSKYDITQMQGRLESVFREIWVTALHKGFRKEVAA